MENSGSSARDVVTCSPNWNHIYTGDSVTLSCDVGPEKNINKNNIMWYKDNKEMKQHKQEFTIIRADSSDSGDYKCWTGFGDRSHPHTIYVIQKDVKNRPTVIFNPNYRNIFTGEKMTISCEDGSSASPSHRYVWYKNNKILENHEKDITINKAISGDSGDYKCERGRGASYPLRLHVHPIFDKVILQTPPNILEGDPSDLRCHSYPSYSNKEEATTFYKDGAIIQKSNQILLNVNKLAIGNYRCEKMFTKRISEETFLFVQDLFTSPKIKSPSDIKEGEAMTLMCETRRNPLREDTELTFTFYRNGETVQELGSSHTYTVLSTKGKDTGKYTCEVRTPSDTVIKMSDALYIRIRVTSGENPEDEEENSTYVTVRAAQDPVTGITIESDKDHSIQWLLLGIPALVFILVVGLLVMCRKKMPSGCCHKKPPSTGMNTAQKDQDMDKENGGTDSEGIYANDPSPCSAATTREDFMVLCSMVTKMDQKTPGISDSSDIYQNMTVKNMNHYE